MAWKELLLHTTSDFRSSLSMSKLLGNYEKLCNHSKWEFIIYRCDYRDDSSWQIFINAWSNRVRQWLYTDDLSRLIQTSNFTDRESQAFWRCHSQGCAGISHSLDRIRGTYDRATKWSRLRVPSLSKGFYHLHIAGV